MQERLLNGTLVFRIAGMARQQPNVTRSAFGHCACSTGFQILT
jgi:hypothetical protein